MGWRNFNDRLALLLTVAMPLLWILHGRGIAPLPGEILGATIATWTLVVQYYFRRKPEDNPPSNHTPE